MFLSVKKNAITVRPRKINTVRLPVRKTRTIRTAVNIRFFADDAGQFMLKTSAKMLEDKSAGIDVVFMDPPRAGSDENFMSSVVKLAPRKVVYVSCNPETLARDLKYFTKNGYKVENAVPVDMFPHTHHVENVVALKRK
mgnify:CR=1 FL=1